MTDQTTAAPAGIVPTITFTKAMVAHGVKIKAGTVLSYSDPLHQRILSTLVSRFHGLSVSFGASDPSANDAANRESLAQANQALQRHIDILATIESGRRTEIAALEADIQTIIETARSEAGKRFGSMAGQEVQMQAFLATDDGKALSAERGRKQARIDAVIALIAAAKAGTDSTIPVTLAQVSIRNAQKRIAALTTLIAGSAPAGGVSVLSTPAGAETASPAATTDSSTTQAQ